MQVYKNTDSLKAKLLKACIEIQQKRVEISRQAMLQAQESANGEKGMMGDKFESFREQMQIDRDMYARQFDESTQVLQVLRKIDPDKSANIPSLGAIVLTDSQSFFVSASLGQVVTDDKNYIAISSQSPMFQAMAGKKKGEKFTFRDKSFLIKDIL
ncbi:MAG: hypothetical protein ACXWEY_16815 [Bacteroidia bacterium]